MKSAITKAEQHLRNSDHIMAKLVQAHGPCTLFAEQALIHKSGFHALSWAIINQQLSVASARSIENKLLARLGSIEFEARPMAKLKDSELASCGLSRQKMRYLRALCEKINTRQLDLEHLAVLGDSEIYETLIALPGIGPWSIDMYLMFSLGRLDILPIGDLALRKAFSQHYPVDDNARPAEYRRLAESWRPYRTVASWYLWASVD